MENAGKATLILGASTFELSSQTLRDASGAVLSLRTQSLKILVELARTPGQLVSRDALAEVVWPDVAVTDDSLVQCIKDIRGALMDRDRTIVKTVIGQGYILNGRTAEDPMGALPVIFVERFRAAPGIAEELAEALFEELIVRLSPRRGVALVTEPDGRPGAKYVISGRVSERSGSARIFFRIARRGYGADLHAATEQAEDAAIWDLPGQVADAISAQLRVRMIMGDGSEFAQIDDASLSTQELMAKAAWHMCRFRRRNWRAARAALEQAVRLAPDHPIALAMLASVETQMIPLIPFSELTTDPERTMALCDRAVEIDQSSDWVLRTRGNVRFWLLGEHEGAGLDCRRALAINPSFHLAHLTIATSEILSGSLEAGARRLEEMMRRVSFDPQNPLYFSLIALSRLLDGQVETATELAREGHERNPLGAWNALVYAAAASGNAGITGTEAFQRMVQRVDLSPSHFLDFPFTDPGMAEALQARALAAGIAEKHSRPS
ncbi:winged helix-turn-helix domain-containing protein [Oceanibium sediminis]|uniref:winged helix-turn-helix domain-containing protein n=1 Tax=Oceanibium sediminis TaxID=2026339 RepID=UPI00130088B8|nr:winged helix-turn-helix domain-containing protein [Oceanibium sediminis]